jgi:DNA invertase Pin-like site-specific DNA recombinase
MADAYQGQFRVLVVWALDRICREGIEELLRLVRELAERNCTLMSVQEPWCSGADVVTELLLGITGWKDKQESARRSERVKAGMERARRHGNRNGTLNGDGRPRVGGRKAGAKDRKPIARVQRSEAVRAAWAGPGGAARRAALAERNRGRAREVMEP